ncbi:hypothetical protein PG991_003465 [Apiospora marii]|uniref:FAD-binding PCMH-type domain-containing protein n=1 Tax=Apiospora marii TaxID=335849 RepID=A0ABR1S3L3_9PEZI
MTMIRAASEAVVSELMRSGLNKDLLSPAGSIRYDERIASYFSLTAQKKPFCFVHPKTTEDVALILKAILANPEGPLRHPQRWPRLVSIQPGARWRDVYKHLGDAHGEVAGLLTGGGISWYIPRVGFCGVQLVNAEVILADGRVVHANNDEHADLWRALKGASAGNFGIVTRFDVRALPNDGLWAGTLRSEATPGYSADYVGAMKSQFKDVITTTFLANTKGVESPPELRRLCNIPTLHRDLKQTNLHDFACSMDQPMGMHNFWHTTTFLNDERIMNKAVELHAVAVRYRLITAAWATSAAEMLWVWTRPSAGGGNAIMLMLLINVGGEEPAEARDVGYRAARAFYEGVEAFAREVDGFVDWTYLNYADRAQNPLRSLLDPEEVRRTALKYDPEGVFRRRAPGGFKISEYEAEGVRG